MVDRVRSADVVLFQGEGTMGPSRYYENLRFFGLPFLASRLWKKPVISLNQSFVIDRDMDRAAAVNIFGRFEVVALREQPVTRTVSGKPDRYCGALSGYGVFGRVKHGSVCTGSIR